MAKLLLLFTIVPLVELYLLLLIGGWLGFWPTVALVLVTGLAGALLAKREGLRTLERWRSSLGQGRMPEEGVLGGALLLVGGVLLVTPGVLTDVAGLALLLPASRRLVAAWLRPWVQRRIERGMDAGSIRVVRAGVGLGDDGPPPPGGGGDDWLRPEPRSPRGAAQHPVIDVPGQVVDRGASRGDD